MKPAAAGPILLSELAFYRELKAVTQPLHDRLEASIPLLDPQLTLDAYRNILRRFYGIYAPFEAVINRATYEPFLSSHSCRSQAEWLEQDLRALGDDADQLAAIPRCSTLPSLSSRAKLLGALYVMQGATLGGQFVIQTLKTSVGPQALRSTRFFQSYGDQVKPMWVTFLERLVRAADSPQEECAIIESACNTFACFERWFSRFRAPTRNCHGDDRSE